MKVVDVNSLIGTERDVVGRGFRSVRPVLHSEGVGFSVHKTIIPKGKPQRWHYKQHLETCYCIEGEGVLINLTTGVEHPIYKDVIYILDDNDDHTFEAKTDVVLISVFNPPMHGGEIHDKDGSYKRYCYDEIKGFKQCKTQCDLCK